MARPFSEPIPAQSSRGCYATLRSGSGTSPNGLIQYFRFNSTTILLRRFIGTQFSPFRGNFKPGHDFL